MSNPEVYIVPEVLPAPPESVYSGAPQRRYWLHILLLLLTLLTATVVGARLQAQFAAGQPAFVADDSFFPLSWLWRDPARLLAGLPFSGSLLAILLAHELGHFLLAVRRGVYATLPYFLPAPTPLGTFGAFIQIKSPFGDRNSLFDIAVAGPIAGFLVALPVSICGLALSQPLPAGVEPSIGQPLVFHLAWFVLRGLGVTAAWLPLSGMALHPLALAGWIGMLATFLNLLPAGQLDGGHIAYALGGRLHRRSTLLTLLALAPLGIFFWTGWLLWAAALFFVRRHPAVPQWPPLSRGRKILALVAALIFLLTMIPQPILGGSAMEVLSGIAQSLQ